MKNIVFYTENNSNLLASLNNTPVVRQKIHSVSYPAEAYDDYGVSGVYYYPSFNFSILLIVLGVIVFVLQILSLFGIIALFTIPKKSIKCPKCRHENFRVKGEFPENCLYCGTKLRK